MHPVHHLYCPLSDSSTHVSGISAPAFDSIVTAIYSLKFGPIQAIVGEIMIDSCLSHCDIGHVTL